MRFCGQGRGSDPEERIQQAGIFGFSVDFDALFDQGDWKRGGVRAFAFAGLDSFVRDKPGVSATTEILTFRVAPARDVGFMHVRHASGAAIQRDIAGFGEVKHVFVAVVHVSLGIDRFEMPSGNWIAIHGGDGDRFDPVKRVLQNEQGIQPIGEGENELVGEQWIRWCGTDVEEKRRVFRHHAVHLCGPRFAPSEKFIARSGVFERGVVDPQIVGRRRHDEVEEFLIEGGEDFQAIAG